jgi:chitinase
VVELCNTDGTTEVCTASNAAVLKVTGGSGGGGTVGTSPWDYLDNSEWEARKAAGMRDKNVPYQNTDGKRVASYFVEWGVYGRAFNPKDIPVENLTHLIYGFIPVCGPNESLTGTAKSALTSQCANKQDYEVVVHDKFAALEKNNLDGTGKWDDPIKGIFAEMYRMKMTYPEIKIIPSIGGWTLSDPLYDIGTDPAARAIFIKSVIDFIDLYDFFDGIDIDWEFPGGGGANPALGSPEDGAGFATLMEELRVALDELGVRKNRTYELMAAVSGGVSKVSEIDWERAIKAMDHVNLMTYDYYGAWSQTYGHQTGLYDTNDLATPIDGFTVDDVVTYLVTQRQVPAEKLSVGVAKYGRGWTGITGGSEQGPFVASASGGTPISGSSADGFWEKGIVDYKGLENNQLGGADGAGANGYTLFWDNTAKASYLWNFSNGTLITFDTKRSVIEKGKYINAKGLGGIFSWEIDADSGTLLNAMHEGLGHPQK